jgi:hypothetical protein
VALATLPQLDTFGGKRRQITGSGKKTDREVKQFVLLQFQKQVPPPRTVSMAGITSVAMRVLEMTAIPCYYHGASASIGLALRCSADSNREIKLCRARIAASSDLQLLMRFCHWRRKSTDCGKTICRMLSTQGPTYAKTPGMFRQYHLFEGMPDGSVWETTALRAVRV